MIIIICSILIQFFTAFYAILLIRKTDIIVSWLFISAALTLMGIRRLISLYDYISYGGAHLGYTMELTGLIISLLMLLGVIGIGRIFIERKEYQQDIDELLNTREMLLKEVHHRIKNNMGTISSLLKLQAEYMTNSSAREALASAGARVEGMLILYDRLYRSENYGIINADEYLTRLIDQIVMNNSGGTEIETTKDIEKVDIPVEKINYIGIIANEIVTNSIKYAFDGMPKGKIDIKLSSSENKISISIKDNGRGIDTEKSGSGFGMELIRLLVQKMNGTIEIKNDSGTSVSFSVEI